MSLKDTHGKIEPIPQEKLEEMTKEELIQLIRLYEGFTKGRNILGHFFAAAWACFALPALVSKFGAVGFILAPFVGVFVMYVFDQTTAYFTNRKTK